MTISQPSVSSQADVELGRLIAATFRTDDKMLDTNPIPACTPSAAARFMEKVEVANNGCFLWTASLDEYGYGRFRLEDRTYKAHRVAYAWRNGPIKQGFTVGHRCHDLDPTCLGGIDCLHRRCVNPDHLAAETQRDNTLAGNTINADHLARDCCPRGHALAGINLSSSALRRAERECRVCSVVYQRAYGPVSRHGGTAVEATAAGQRALATLTGGETPSSIGLEPLQIHLEHGLAIWHQSTFNLEVSR